MIEKLKKFIFQFVFLLLLGIVLINYAGKKGYIIVHIVPNCNSHNSNIDIHPLMDEI